MTRALVVHDIFRRESLCRGEDDLRTKEQICRLQNQVRAALGRVDSVVRGSLSVSGALGPGSSQDQLADDSIPASGKLPATLADA